MRTPRAAAVAGILFGLLLVLALVLVRLAVHGSAQDHESWVTDSGKRRTVRFGLDLVPFAGIAFLWFIGVARDRIGDREDRFFGTVFLGSGLLFIAMLFSASASAGALLLGGDEVPSPSLWNYGARAATTLLSVYAMRMAAVFTLTTTSLFARHQLAPRWLVVLGYASAVTLLVASSEVPWLELLFPTWVLVLSVYLLLATLRVRPTPEPNAVA